MMVVSFNSYTIGATIGAGTVALPGAPELSPVLIGVRVAQYFVVCVCFFFFYHCLSFCPFSFGHCVICPSSELRLPIVPLVSSNFSRNL
jgi:hypothetical protein